MVNMKKQNMPRIPDLFYRNEWKGWGDFLKSVYPYDWEIVEILKFNYNGMGDAVANCDGRTTYIHMIDLNEMLFGNQFGGQHYETIVNSNRFIMKKIHYEEIKPTKKKGKNVQKKTKKSK